MSDGITVTNRSGDDHPDNVLKAIKEQNADLWETVRELRKQNESLRGEVAAGALMGAVEFLERAASKGFDVCPDTGDTVEKARDVVIGHEAALRKAEELREENSDPRPAYMCRVGMCKRRPEQEGECWVCSDCVKILLDALEHLTNGFAHGPHLWYPKIAQEALDIYYKRDLMRKERLRLESGQKQKEFWEEEEQQ